MDQSDAGSVGTFSRRTNQTQEVWAYSHDGPIRRRKRGYILTADQSDAGSVGIFSRWTNQAHPVAQQWQLRLPEARHHDVPLCPRREGCKKGNRHAFDAVSRAPTP
eukprot:84644-Prorocentrum_minimum.AAC.1